MATVPPPDSIPETPPMDPGGAPDEVPAPSPDTDYPDPSEAEAHPT